MNKNLFQIANEMTQLIEYGCDEDGIIAQTQEEFNEMYDNIQLELTTKIDNTNGIIKMIASDIALADTEIKRLEALKKDAKKHISWMTDRIDYVLRQQNTNEDGVLNIEGLPVYRDSFGGIGTPTSDHERTKMDLGTTHILAIVNGYNGKDGLQEAVEMIQTLLRNYTESDGGEIVFFE